jgi:glycosyltransferase involved in cell wall biosynthesis
MNPCEGILNQTASRSGKIAFVHDWLVTWGGGEQVLEAALEVYPSADIYTLVYQEETFVGSPISTKDIKTSFIQRLPGSRSNHRRYLPFMPLAVEQFDLSGYEWILSSNHAVANGALTQPDQMHVSYIHAPMRYAWGLYHQYLEQGSLTRGLKSWIARAILHYVRLWDYQAAQRVDHFIANSAWTAKNVWRAYRRQADVIYPPVNVEEFMPASKRSDYYITISRLVPYKRIDIIVQAFNCLGYPLLVIGDGPDLIRLGRLAESNIEFLGWQSDTDLKEKLSRAKAFVYAAVEDFGITPVEAQAAGCPVIAYGKGGLRETVIGGSTGLFFYAQTPESLIKAVQDFEADPARFKVSSLRENAERFNKERFQRVLTTYIERKYSEFQREKAT